MLAAFLFLSYRSFHIHILPRPSVFFSSFPFRRPVVAFVPKEGDLAMNLVATFDKITNDDDDEGGG